MKRISSLLLLTTFALGLCAEEATSVTIEAWEAAHQTYTKPVNYVGLGLKLGYSQFNMKNDYLNIPGGANAGLEFRYKLEKGAFRFTLGLDATYAGNSFRGSYEKGAQLSEPTPEMTYYYQFSNMYEQEHVLEVGVPIMFGANFKGFYAQVGARIGLPVMSKYKIKADFTPYITDERGIDIYRNLPNHFLVDGTPTGNGKMTLALLDPQVSAEIGMNLDRWLQKKVEQFTPGYKPTFKELLHYEIALYANVGVLNYNNAKDKTDMCYIEPGQSPRNYAVEDLNSVTTYNEFAAVDGKDTRMMPWNVGVRFNVYYEIYDAPKVPKRTRQHRDRPDAVIIDEPEPEPEVVYQGDTVKQGDTITLDNLYFDTDKTIIRRISLPVIEDLARWLNENPSIKITLVGHTDNVGKPLYNQRLSLGRVNSVKAELVKRGVGADRVKTVGKGMTQPIASNATEEGRAKNRRVEVIIDEK